MHDAESPEHLTDPPAKPVEESPYAVLRNVDFIRYLIGRFVASLGQQMLVVAIDWELYERTGSALALAFVGLSQMVPMILCTLPAGHFADNFSRKKIILITTLALALASLGLTLCSAMQWPVSWIYLCLVVIGAARTFLWPASAAFLPGLVPRRQFARAVTYNSGTFQISQVIGPAACGMVILLAHHTAWAVYALNALASLICFVLVLPIKHEQKLAAWQPMSVKNLIEGFRFVFDNKSSSRHHAGFVRGAAGRRGDVAADLREGYFSHRPVRFGLVARRHAHRRGGVCVLDGPSRAVAKGGRGDAVVGGDFRRGDDCVRNFAVVLVFIRDAHHRGRGGQCERRRAADARANPDAG
ncbi:MAG: MFS transporter [Limisphaerales bacterium]